MSKVVFFRGISVLYWQEEEKLVVNHENSLRYPTINEYLRYPDLPDTHTRRNTEPGYRK